jgi:hypothetical protein
VHQLAITVCMSFEAPTIASTGTPDALGAADADRLVDERDLRRAIDAVRGLSGFGARPRARASLRRLVAARRTLVDVGLARRHRLAYGRHPA